MYNINFDNINTDDLNKCFESGLSKEREMFDESLKKEAKVAVILVKMGNEFHQLLKDICTGKFGKVCPSSLYRMKGIIQSLHFAPLFSMRGNIRAGYSEMRFLIEEICLFVYYLDDKNCEVFEEEIEKRAKEKGLSMRNTDDNLTLKIRCKVNESQKNLAHKYLKEIDPAVNNHLKRFKDIINDFFMHGSAIGIHDDKGVNLSDDVLIVEGFDSKELRDENLKRSMTYMILIMFYSYNVVCTGLEKRLDTSMREHRARVESVKNLLKKLVSPPDSENVWDG